MTNEGGEVTGLADGFGPELMWFGITPSRGSRITTKRFQAVRSKRVCLLLNISVTAGRISTRCCGWQAAYKTVISLGWAKPGLAGMEVIGSRLHVRVTMWLPTPLSTWSRTWHLVMSSSGRFVAL